VSLALEARRQRVRAVLVAARRIADPTDPLGQRARSELPGVTGLSPQGVSLGLDRYLETDASESEIDRLVERAGTAPRVHLVLSANVFVGAVRALAVAVAAAPEVSVRPSRREPIMAELLARAVAEGGELDGVELVAEITPVAGDEVHVYGRRESIALLTQNLVPGVLVRGHGPGMGIAIVEAGESLDFGRAAALCSWDVIAFDQRGCLSPRVVVISGTIRDAELFFDQLSAELTARQREIPRGVLSKEERTEGALYRDTMAAIGRCRAGDGGTVGLDTSPRALLLPPPGRHVHVARVSAGADLLTLLAPFADVVTCLGTAGDGPFARRLVAELGAIRRSPLGRMQMPPFDGPVDLRGIVGA
jgi:hypothetical protein